jgi:FdhE protein
MGRAALGTAPARARPPADPVLAAAARRLDALGEQSPELAAPAAFYREALPLLRQAQARVPAFALAPAEVERKLAQGRPLLVGEDLPLEAAAARALFVRLCRVLERGRGPAGRAPSRWPAALDPLRLMERVQAGDGATLQAAAARQLRLAVERRDLNLAEAWAALAAGEWARLERLAAGLRVDAGLLGMLAQTSLRPALRAWAHSLAATTGLDGWRRGYCPMCGGSPALSEIQGKEGARHLRCGVCGADWYYARLQCAFCGCEDYKQLGYLSVEGEAEKYRVQTCDRCHGYLKIVVTFEPTPTDLLIVEDLATLHLDVIAQERGFARVAVRL